MDPWHKERAHYAGTTIGEKWWKRYREHGFLARGLGAMKLTIEGIWFHRRLTKKPLLVRWERIRRLRYGTWHAGQWAGGNPVLKVHWEERARELVSGYVPAKDSEELARWAAEIEKRATIAPL